MSKVITLDLFDSASIKRAADNLNRIAKNFKELDKKILEEVCSSGAETCREQIIMHGATDSGELYDSVGYEVTDDVGHIYANATHAKFVEYGTGVVGNGTYPNGIPWAYDIHGHGEDGWVYYKKGSFHWTQGQASRPFMYDTAKELKNEGLSKAVKKVIERELQK